MSSSDYVHAWCRAIGEFWGWLQRAPKRQLQRSVLATLQWRRLQQSMQRRKQRQRFRRLRPFSVLVLHQMPI
jgi:Ser/Thr protein kinase RdoA (MazF antagonist)